MCLQGEAAVLTDFVFSLHGKLEHELVGILTDEHVRAARLRPLSELKIYNRRRAVFRSSLSIVPRANNATTLASERKPDTQSARECVRAHTPTHTSLRDFQTEQRRI